MLARANYFMFHHNGEDIFEKKINEMWSNGSETIEEAVAKFEGTIYMGDPHGPFMNTDAKSIDIRYGNQAFVFVGGRRSITEFLKSNAVSDFKFTTRTGDKLAIMTGRKKSAFGKNKTALAVCLVPYKKKPGVMPVAGFSNIQGVLPIDTSGKTLTCQQLASIASVLFGETPVQKVNQLVGTLRTNGIW